MIFVLFDTPASDSSASSKAERQVWIDVEQVEAVGAHRTYVDGSVSIATRIHMRSGSCYTVAMDPDDALKKVASEVNDHGNYDDPVRSVPL